MKDLFIKISTVNELISLIGLIAAFIGFLWALIKLFFSQKYKLKDHDDKFKDHDKRILKIEDSHTEEAKEESNKRKEIYDKIEQVRKESSAQINTLRKETSVRDLHIQTQLSGIQTILVEIAGKRK